MSLLSRKDLRGYRLWTRRACRVKTKRREVRPRELVRLSEKNLAIASATTKSFKKSAKADVVWCIWPSKMNRCGAVWRSR